MSSKKLEGLSIKENEVNNPKRLLDKKIGEKALGESTEENDYLEEAPEGYLAAKTFAKKIRISQPTIESKIQELGIKRARYKSKTGNLREYLSPEQQQEIVDSLEHLILSEEAPEGYLTILAFAEKIGISRTVITSKIQELGIKRARYKSKTGNLREYLSPEQQQEIVDSLEHLILSEEAPEGYLTIPDLAKKLGIDRSTITNKINKLKIIRTEYKKDGQLCKYLSPEQQQEIVDSLEHLVLSEEAPEGYLTAAAFAKKLGIYWEVVANKIQELGITRTKYKNNIGHLCEFLSPEQQGLIIKSFEYSGSRTSIPENTIAFYLKMAGRTIKQSFRPNWLRNPETGRNLEIDVFVDPPGVGIEYDGCFYHQDIERDVKKDSIAQKNGYRIIHIREDGCPEMPEGSICIKRNNNNDDVDLGECIKECFKMLGIPVPGIDIARDKKDIMAFMRQRVCDKIDSARTFEELSVVS